VGKANGSRECAPDSGLRVPTTITTSIAIEQDGGHDATRLCLPYGLDAPLSRGMTTTYLVISATRPIALRSVSKRIA
jgi:hypothetical protein